MAMFLQVVGNSRADPTLCASKGQVTALDGQELLDRKPQSRRV